MAGVNLREGIMEVAFEQWTERTRESSTGLVYRISKDTELPGNTSRLQRFPTLQGNGIG